MKKRKTSEGVILELKYKKSFDGTNIAICVALFLFNYLVKGCCYMIEHGRNCVIFLGL